MDNVYQKARELGALILESDYAKILEEAKENFNKHPDAKMKFDEYTSYKKNIEHLARMGKISHGELAIARDELSKKEIELQSIEELICLLNAEEDYNKYVNKVMQILKSTVSGDEHQHSGCGGCGKH
jgi:cell fate (sporulation/competence/biofilm development) regulator YlbF (YheA/YmcA/DUF963 family)